MSDQVATESGHYYDINGNPAYTVIGSKGQERNTTLRDARKLNLFPSVTTITKESAKPGLIAWMQNEAIWAALTLPRAAGESDDSFVARIKVDSKERARKAAERGTSLHTAIERHIQGKSFDEQFRAHVSGVTECMAGMGLSLTGGNAEKSFAHADGYGGRVDWQNETTILDFKSKAVIEDKKKLAWDEHAMQLAAYAHGLGILNPRCINIFVGIDDCKVVAVEHEQADIEDGLKLFKLLLEFWQTKNHYKPTV